MAHIRVTPVMINVAVLIAEKLPRNTSWIAAKR
jgi:hypothetical protein